MEVKGKIIQAFPPVEGTSKAGNPWKKREYILETQESYPKKIFFDFFGDRADQYPLNVGDVINLSFDIESREYNGRWFVSIRGWKAEPADAAPAPPAQMPGYGYAPAPAPAVAPYGAPAAGGFGAPVPPPAVGDSGATDDLPF